MARTRRITVKCPVLRNRLLMLAGAAWLGAAVGGCAVEGQSFKRLPMESARAIIYVYRPYHFFGSALDPEVTCGNATIAIGAGGYHAFSSDPGIIDCYASTEVTRGVRLYLRPEEDYFVREYVEPGILVGRVDLTPVDRLTGLSEIGECERP
jgi:hypothetical protein